jgi:hypothetical protein
MVGQIIQKRYKGTYFSWLVFPRPTRQRTVLSDPRVGLRDKAASIIAGAFNFLFRLPFDAAPLNRQHPNIAPDDQRLQN